MVLNFECLIPYVKYTIIPKINHIINAIQVERVKFVIKYKQIIKDTIGNTGYKGTLKPSDGNDRFLLKNRTPIETVQNANNVPILISEASSDKGTSPDTIPIDNVSMTVFCTGVCF